MPTDTIEFTEVTAKEFKATYKQALLDGKEVFDFHGREVLTCYAKYLCEYMVMQGLLPKEQ